MQGLRLRVMNGVRRVGGAKGASSKTGHILRQCMCACVCIGVRMRG